LFIFKPAAVFSNNIIWCFCQKIWIVQFAGYFLYFYLNPTNIFFQPRRFGV